MIFLCTFLKSGVVALCVLLCVGPCAASISTIESPPLLSITEVMPQEQWPAIFQFLLTDQSTLADICSLRTVNKQFDSSVAQFFDLYPSLQGSFNPALPFSKQLWSLAIKGDFVLQHGFLTKEDIFGKNRLLPNLLKKEKLDFFRKMYGFKAYDFLDKAKTFKGENNCTPPVRIVHAKADSICYVGNKNDTLDQCQIRMAYINANGLEQDKLKKIILDFRSEVIGKNLQPYCVIFQNDERVRISPDSLQGAGKTFVIRQKEIKIPSCILIKKSSNNQAQENNQEEGDTIDHSIVLFYIDQEERNALLANVIIFPSEALKNSTEQWHLLYDDIMLQLERMLDERKKVCYCKLFFPWELSFRGQLPLIMQTHELFKKPNNHRIHISSMFYTKIQQDSLEVIDWDSINSKTSDSKMSPVIFQSAFCKNPSDKYIPRGCYPIEDMILRYCSNGGPELIYQWGRCGDAPEEYPRPTVPMIMKYWYNQKNAENSAIFLFRLATTKMERQLEKVFGSRIDINRDNMYMLFDHGVTVGDAIESKIRFGRDSKAVDAFFQHLPLLSGKEKKRIIDLLLWILKIGDPVCLKVDSPAGYFISRLGKEYCRNDAQSSAANQYIMDMLLQKINWYPQHVLLYVETILHQLNSKKEQFEIIDRFLFCDLKTQNKQHQKATRDAVYSVMFRMDSNSIIKNCCKAYVIDQCEQLYKMMNYGNIDEFREEISRFLRVKKNLFVKLRLLVPNDIVEHCKSFLASKHFIDWYERPTDFTRLLVNTLPLETLCSCIDIAKEKSRMVQIILDHLEEGSVSQVAISTYHLLFPKLCTSDVLSYCVPSQLILLLKIFKKYEYSPSLELVNQFGIDLANKITKKALDHYSIFDVLHYLSAVSPNETHILMQTILSKIEFWRHSIRGNQVGSIEARKLYYQCCLRYNNPKNKICCSIRNELRGNNKEDLIVLASTIYRLLVGTCPDCSKDMSDLLDAEKENRAFLREVVVSIVQDLARDPHFDQNIIELLGTRCQALDDESFAYVCNQGCKKLPMNDELLYPLQLLKNLKKLCGRSIDPDLFLQQSRINQSKFLQEIIKQSHVNNATEAIPWFRIFPKDEIDTFLRTVKNKNFLKLICRELQQNPKKYSSLDAVLDNGYFIDQYIMHLFDVNQVLCNEHFDVINKHITQSQNPHELARIHAIRENTVFINKYITLLSTNTNEYDNTNKYDLHKHNECIKKLSESCLANEQFTGIALIILLDRYGLCMQGKTLKEMWSLFNTNKEGLRTRLIDVATCAPELLLRTLQIPDIDPETILISYAPPGGLKLWAGTAVLDQLLRLIIFNNTENLIGNNALFICKHIDTLLTLFTSEEMRPLMSRIALLCKCDAFQAHDSIENLERQFVQGVSLNQESLEAIIKYNQKLLIDIVKQSSTQENMLSICTLQNPRKELGDAICNELLKCIIFQENNEISEKNYRYIQPYILRLLNYCSAENKSIMNRVALFSRCGRLQAGRTLAEIEKRFCLSKDISFEQFLLIIQYAPELLILIFKNAVKEIGLEALYEADLQGQVTEKLKEQLMPFIAFDMDCTLSVACCAFIKKNYDLLLEHHNVFPKNNIPVVLLLHDNNQLHSEQKIRFLLQKCLEEKIINQDQLSRVIENNPILLVNMLKSSITERKLDFVCNASDYLKNKFDDTLKNKLFKAIFFGHDGTITAHIDIIKSYIDKLSWCVSKKNVHAMEKIKLLYDFNFLKANKSIDTLLDGLLDKPDINVELFKRTVDINQQFLHRTLLKHTSQKKLEVLYQADEHGMIPFSLIVQLVPLIPFDASKALSEQQCRFVQKYKNILHDYATKNNKEEVLLMLFLNAWNCLVPNQAPDSLFETLINSDEFNLDHFSSILDILPLSYLINIFRTFPAARNIEMLQKSVPEPQKKFSDEVRDLLFDTIVVTDNKVSIVSLPYINYFMQYQTAKNEKIMRSISLLHAVRKLRAGYDLNELINEFCAAEHDENDYQNIILYDPDLLLTILKSSIPARAMRFIVGSDSEGKLSDALKRGLLLLIIKNPTQELSEHHITFITNNHKMFVREYMLNPEKNQQAGMLIYRCRPSSFNALEQGDFIKRICRETVTIEEFSAIMEHAPHLLSLIFQDLVGKIEYDLLNAIYKNNRLSEDLKLQLLQYIIFDENIELSSQQCSFIQDNIHIINQYNLNNTTHNKKYFCAISLICELKKLTANKTIKKLVEECAISNDNRTLSAKFQYVLQHDISLLPNIFLQDITNEKLQILIDNRLAVEKRIDDETQSRLFQAIFFNQDGTISSDIEIVRAHFDRLTDLFPQERFLEIKKIKLLNVCNVLRANENLDDLIRELVTAEQFECILRLDPGVLENVFQVPITQEKLRSFLVASNTQLSSSNIDLRVFKLIMNNVDLKQMPIALSLCRMHGHSPLSLVQKTKPLHFKAALFGLDTFFRTVTRTILTTGALLFTTLLCCQRKQLSWVVQNAKKMLYGRSNAAY